MIAIIVWNENQYTQEGAPGSSLRTTDLGQIPNSYSVMLAPWEGACTSKVMHCRPGLMEVVSILHRLQLQTPQTASSYLNTKTQTLPLHQNCLKCIHKTIMNVISMNSDFHFNLYAYKVTYYFVLVCLWNSLLKISQFPNWLWRHWVFNTMVT